MQDAGYVASVREALSKRSLRLSTTVVDQILASGTTALALVSFARTGPVVEFAAIALVVTAGLSVVGVSRSLTAPWLVQRSQNLAVQDSEARSWFLWICVLGGVATLLGWSIAALGGYPLAPTTLLVCLTFGLAVPREALRILALGTSRHLSALWSDAIWFSSAFVGFLSSVEATQTSTVITALAWFLGAMVSLAFLMWKLSVVPALEGTLNWLKMHYEWLRLLGSSSVLVSLVASLVALAVAWQFGDDDLAGWRGAGLLVSPVTMVLAVVPVLTISSALNRVVKASRKPLGIYLTSASLAFALSVILGVALRGIPVTVGEWLLGDVWNLAHELILPVSLVAGLAVLLQVALSLLKVQKQHRTVAALASFNSLAGLSAVVAVGLIGWSFSIAIYMTGVMTTLACISSWLLVRRLFIQMGGKCT